MGEIRVGFVYQERFTTQKTIYMTISWSIFENSAPCNSQFGIIDELMGQIDESSKNRIQNKYIFKTESKILIEDLSGFDRFFM